MQPCQEIIDLFSRFNEESQVYPVWNEEHQIKPSWHSILKQGQCIVVRCMTDWIYHDVDAQKKKTLKTLIASWRQFLIKRSECCAVPCIKFHFNYLESFWKQFSLVSCLSILSFFRMISLSTAKFLMNSSILGLQWKSRGYFDDMLSSIFKYAQFFFR